MHRKRIDILFSNDKKIYRLYWIEQTGGSDIYHGFYISDNLKWSHHKDGNTHAKIKNNSLLQYKSSPISKLQNIRLLSMISFTNNDSLIKRLNIKEYTNEKLNHPILIDTRLFPKNISINIGLFLIRPGSIHLLNSFKHFNEYIGDYHILQVFDIFEPWLVVHVKGISNPTQAGSPPSVGSGVCG